ncbi:ankyrin repeat domain-containing protein 16-like [Diorhabda sublineata]|uniref:ankyrin repeat domain-containing protein 16-like n=1 Tax=Diorhabda sublineata TaxID=1163346 RepID=UPI0024E0F445|nr:ankyrin repeat domain-containing protein 16-like [Diorhabda sublineata]
MALHKPSEIELRKVLKDIQNGNHTILKDFLKSSPNVHWSSIHIDKQGNTILHLAARLGNTNVITYLMENFHPKAVNCKNKDDKTALHEAAQFGQFESSKILLKYGADVNALKRADWTPLMLVCTKINSNENYKILDLFLKGGALVNCRNKDGWTCLHLICREGNVEMLELLVKSGLNLTVKSKNGRTGLHVAALHGHSKIINKLLDLNSNVNEIDSIGNTPLHEAVLGGQLDICRILIKRGADISCKNNLNLTLLHLASSQGNIEMISFILKDLMININETCKTGLTPLHCAAKNNHKEAYEFLIKQGADTNILDKFHRKASEYFS